MTQLAINKQLKKLLTLMFVLVVGASCKTVKEGIITDKWYEEPTSSMGVIYTGKIAAPTYIFDDEDFVIKLKGLNKSGKIKTQNYYISKTTYDTLNIGSWFCVSKDCRTKDN